MEVFEGVERFTALVLVMTLLAFGWFCMFRALTTDDWERLFP